MNRTLFTLLIGLVLLSACSGAPDLQKSGVSTQPVVPIPTASLATSSQPTVAAKPSTIITDALGRQVSFSNPPKRIVITGKALIMVVDAVYMFPEAPERIAALGNAGQGTSNFISLIDPNYTSKAILQQDAGVEQIAAAKP